MPKSHLGPSDGEESPLERTWQLTCEAYARGGVDVFNRPMDRTIRKLTRNEWLKSEEDAHVEFEALTTLPRSD
jgi:hypothetical protein